MLNGNIINTNENPIPELINDDIYDLLTSRGLINEKSVRDYLIKKDSEICVNQKCGQVRQLINYVQNILIYNLIQLEK